VPVISAWILNYILSEQFQEPSEKRSIAENFINMAFPKLDPDQKNLSSKAMDIIFLLHADHEQNASTSTVRLSGSSETSPYAAIAAGISTLWGPTHGGANEAVINMLEEIKNSDKDVEHYINMAKDKENTFRLMGFGHRIYKNYDPRAKIIQKIAHEYLSQLDNTNPNKPLFDIAMKLEKFALEDDYFVSRKLYPNVDFYSGIVLKAIGIPQSMYTVIFALARTVGWVAHWNEMIEDKNFRIGRPRQLYTVKNKTGYKDIKDR
jgi:citrate synthase